MSYRQDMNGNSVAIDKVEVASQVGRKASELQAMRTVTSLVSQFLSQSANSRYYFTADHLDAPLTDQPPDAFELMRADLVRICDAVSGAGGTVVKSADHAQGMEIELYARLPQLDRN